MDIVGSEGGPSPCHMHAASDSAAPPVLLAYSAKGLSGICEMRVLSVCREAGLYKA